MEKPNSRLSRYLYQPDTVDSEQGYLLGLRGFAVIQSFLWVFLQTFVPVAVKDSANPSGPLYQEILRKTLSVLFWNESLLYSFFILLSARTICIPFLRNPSKSAVASAVFRRGLRLWFPTAVSLAFVKIVSSSIGFAYIDNFKQQTGNVSINAPYHMPNALAYFNSVFNIFWTTNKFFEQAGNTAFPSQTLWIVNVIYAQSYTVYMTMIIVPYTRNSWRVKAYLCFIVTAWWVQSWAWYSITGLLLADMVMNMQYKERSKRGIRVWRGLRCPAWIPCLIVMAAGLVMLYLCTAWRPQYANNELLAHTGLYYSGGLNNVINPLEPQARDDNYLLLLGFFLFFEQSEFLQKIFQNPFFMYLGRRSLSKSLFPPKTPLPSHVHYNSLLTLECSLGWFLVQSIIIYTAGIKLFTQLSSKQGWSVEAANWTCLVVCLATIVLGAEIFHRLVDCPSQALAHVVFDWIRE